MALAFFDGFDDGGPQWVHSAVQMSSSGSRSQGGYPGSTGQGITYSIPTALESDWIVVGVAIGGLATSPAIQLRSDNGNTTHVTVNVNSSGQISITSGSVLQTSAAGIIKFAAVASVSNIYWSYVEVKVRLHDTLGSYEVRVNEETILSGSNVDTKQGGTKTTFDTVRLTGTGSTNYYDDLYIQTGDVPFLGDVVVETLFPNGNGNVNQWVGSDADSTDNYLLVDEIGQPSVTDYVAATTDGLQDMYAMTNLSRTQGTILGVMHVAVPVKNDHLAKSIKVVNRRTTDNKSPELPIQSIAVAGAGVTPPAFNYHIWETDPETSAPWTITDVNNLQSGIEVVAPSGPVTILTEPFNDLTTNPGWVNIGATIVAGGMSGTCVEVNGSTAEAHWYFYVVNPAEKSPDVTVDFWWKTVSTMGQRSIFTLYTENGTVAQASLRVNADGSVSTLRGAFNATVLTSTATGLIVVDTWYHMVWRVHIEESPNGLHKLDIDGTNRINITGVDTHEPGSGSNFGLYFPDRLTLLGPLSGATCRIDDLQVIIGAPVT